MARLLIEAIGTTAAICSTTSFVPQLIKLLREKKAEAISLRMYAVTVTGFTLWLAYGCLLGSLPLIFSNAISLALSSAILGLTLHYGRAAKGVAPASAAAPAPAQDAMLDCLVVGAGPAGLTAALYLARYRRSVVVAHDGESRAATIPRSHNVAGYPAGVEGRELIERMRAHATAYGARIEDNPITAIERDGDGFVARGRDRDYRCRTVILATGVRLNDVDLTPEVRNQAMADGRLRYCPVCDGFEVTGKTVAVMGCDAHGAAEALFLRTYSDDVTLLPRVRADLGAAERRKLKAAGVRVVEGRTGGLEITASDVKVTLKDQAQALRFDVLYPALGCRPRSELARGLGVKTNAEGCIITDPTQHTSVPGVFAAGDVVEGLDQISVATGHGAIAATQAHNFLRDRAAETLSAPTAKRRSGTARAAAR
jgi:thioredoxin reductase (NADPH)